MEASGLTPDFETLLKQAEIAHLLPSQLSSAEKIRLQKASALLKEQCSLDLYYASQAKNNPFYWIEFALDWPNLCKVA
jgi:hypothetical protein